MAMLFSNPVDAVFQLQQALDAFRTSGWLGSSPSGRGAYPPLNVFRKGEDLVDRR
jgi:HSP20 family protein